MFDLKTELKFSKLSREFNRKQFNSGKEQLDKFIKNYALLNQGRGFGVTWVLHKKESAEIIGYYTIATAQVEKIEIPNEYTSKLPTYPLPCQIIGKLAIDLKYQGKGYGEYILYSALKKAKEISSEIGCFAVIVDALNNDAKRFYLKYGFTPFIDDQLRLFLTIGSIP